MNTIPFQPVRRDEVSWLGTTPIPAAPYYDPAYFELEREAVFKRSWLQIGHVCELSGPGSFIRREVEAANASVLITRGKDNEIRAFHNICTHRGTELVQEESGRRANFSCRYHRWTFGTDGALLSAPDFEQFNLAKADCGLLRVAVEICAGLIFINFAPDPTPLRESLGDLTVRLEALPISLATNFTEYVYEIEANWKLTYDNFQENYHLRFIHPRSSGAGIGAENPFGYAAGFSFHGQHRKQIIWSNPAPPPPPYTLSLAFRQALASAAAKGHVLTPGPTEYFALFPNFFLLGSALQPFSQMVMPISATRSRGVIRIYWIGEDASASERFAREALMASARDVHCEDRDVILAGQKGLSSGALKHIHFQTQEALCRHLYLQVDAMVQAYKAEDLV